MTIQRLDRAIQIVQICWGATSHPGDGITTCESHPVPDVNVALGVCGASLLDQYISILRAVAELHVVFFSGSGKGLQGVPSQWQMSSFTGCHRKCRLFETHKDTAFRVNTWEIKCSRPAARKTRVEAHKGLLCLRENHRPILASRFLR